MDTIGAFLAGNLHSHQCGIAVRIDVVHTNTVSHMPKYNF